MSTQPIPASITPEINLLLCCARKSLKSCHSLQLRKTLPLQIDWPLLIHLADENGLLPLVCHHLREFSDAIPPDSLAKLREANRQNSIRALFLISELHRITDALRQRSIPALPYKGPILAHLAYGNALLRQFDDLDIVVRQASVAQVYDEMDALGYQARFSRERFLDAEGKNIPGEYVFVHRVNRAIVEFHTEETLRHFPRPPGLESMLSRAVTIALNGRQFSTFSPTDTILMLCVHGAKDFWSRLIWVADIAELSVILTDADWELLFNEAKRCDAQRMVALGLWLAHSLFHIKIPSSINLGIDHEVPKIGADLRAQLLEQTPLPAGLLWRSLYRVRMVPPLWKGIGYWLRLSTAPAEEDWSAADDAFSRARPPYALLRPIRLWRKYGRTRRVRQADDKSEISDQLTRRT